MKIHRQLYEPVADRAKLSLHFVPAQTEVRDFDHGDLHGEQKQNFWPMGSHNRSSSTTIGNVRQQRVTEVHGFNLSNGRRLIRHHDDGYVDRDLRSGRHAVSRVGP
jgi:hypothetical protein